MAVIGDGAMSAGMAFEALNNAGVAQTDMLVVLNDNDMSISPPVGALNRYLARLMSGRFYAAARDTAKTVLKNAPPLFELARRFEEHAKGMVVPGTIFEEFGFNYVGPIDGHDLDSLIPTLENLRQLKGPQFLHVVTKKGYGYKLAENDPVNYHGPSKFDPEGRHRQAADAAQDHLHARSSATGCATWPRRTSGWSASRRRCARAPAWSSSSSASRSATSMSASPSSTPSPSPPAWPPRA